MTDEEAPQLDPDPVRRGRRWPMGTLALLAVAAIVLGVLAFNQRQAELERSPDAGTTPGVLTVPDLPVPRIDDPAPDFAVDLIGGGRFVLSDHFANDGRPVFLNLWASWCIPCRAEMPAIDAAAATHTGVLFLGVAVKDDPTEAEKFAEEIGVTYLLGIDETDRLAELYPSFGLPATFLISADARIVTTFTGEVTEEQIDGLIASMFYG